MTTAEQSLVDAGDLDAVHRLRRDARDAVGARAKAIVEEATGHRVSAYMCEIHPDADLVVEVFVLEALSSR